MKRSEYSGSLCEEVDDAAKERRPTVEIDIDKVANLSKLTLTPEEKETMKRELSEIIAFADQLSALDTEGVEPTAHVLPVQNVLREDILCESLPREALLANAPEVKDGCLCVPKTVNS